MAAPVLDLTTFSLPTLVEGATDPAGIAIADLLGDGAVSDADGVVRAIALTGVDASLGTWQYSTDGGASWLTVDAALLNSQTNEAALLLDGTHLLRLLPFAGCNGSLPQALSFRAWDQGTGTAGSYAVIEATGGDSAFSDAVGTAGLAVTATNSAPSFAPASGMVSTGIGATALETANAVHVQPDGKLLVSGYSFDGNFTFAVARYNADGSLDTGFAGGAGKLLAVVESGSFGFNLVMFPDGGFVMVGGASNFGLLKFHADGTLDSGFDGDGVVATDLGGFDRATCAAVQADGKLVLAGFTGPLGGPYNLGIVRYNADGSVDTGFAGGTVALDLGSDDRANAVAVQADGRIVVAGTSGNDAVVLRFLADGTLDSSFGDSGIARASTGSASTGQSLVLLADGHLLVGGSNGSDFMVLRFHADGTLDTGFGSGGMATVDIASGSGDAAYQIAVQADGRIVVAGLANGDAALARLNADGSQDSTFGSGGVASAAFSDSATDAGYALALQPDGRIVLSGYVMEGAEAHFAVGRFNADGTRDQSFGTSIGGTGNEVSITEGDGPVVLNPAMAVQDNDLALLGGYAGATLTLARDGGASADDVFGGAGILALADGQVALGAVTVGSFTQDGGTLQITFNAEATQARVNQVLSSLTYASLSDNPPADIAIAWTFSDGNSGAQGEGGALSATATTVVHVAPVNDAPQLADGWQGSLAVDDDGSTTLLIPVSGLAAGGSDAETGGGALGVAITGLDAAVGTWQYSLDGSTWSAIDVAQLNAGTGTALLLGGQAALRVLVPEPGLQSSASGAISLRLWDQSSGTEGALEAIGAVGGTSAFSDGAGTYTLDLQALNDSPTFVGTVPAGWVSRASSADEPAFAVRVMEDGALLVGSAGADGTGFALTRYLSDGTLDPAFGQHTLSLPGSGVGEARTLTVQADGKILVAGRVENGGEWMMAVGRFNSDGSADTGFGDGGVALLAQPGTVLAVVPLTGGLILVAGEDDEGLGRVLALDASGAQQTGWSVDGFANVAPTGGVQALAADAFDGAYVGGTQNGDFVLAKLVSDGSINSGFNGNAAATVDLGGDEALHAIVLQADGKVVMVGNSSGDIAVVRVSGNGALDTAFGDQGKVLIDNAGKWDEGHDVTLLADGRILIAGFSSQEGDHDFTVVRLQADGSFDTSFGGTGIVSVPLAGDDRAYSIDLQDDGRIVVSGSTSGDGHTVQALLRLNDDGSIDTGFGAEVRDTVSGTVAFTEGGAAVVLAPDAAVFDEELSALGGGSGNFEGATLTLQRLGGASADDHFVGTGSTELTAGLAFVDGTPIGSAVQDGGVLQLTFSGSATQAAVNTLLSGLAYSNSSTTPPASVQIAWTFSDQNAGAQGAGGALSATATVTVTLTDTDSAPQLDPTPVPFGTLLEDTSGTVTCSVADLLAGKVADDGGVSAMAVTSVSTVLGDWSYSTDGGQTWTAIDNGQLIGGSALLLESTALLRLEAGNQPLAGAQGAVGYRAWDMKSGNAGDYVPVASVGGSSPFSVDQGTANLMVTPVNDAPSFDEPIPTNGWSASSGADLPFGMAELADGKLLVAASIAGDGGASLLRFHADGSLDTGFGRVVVQFADSSTATSLLVLDDGGIVLGGQALAGGSWHPAVMRLLADGSADTGFGTGGVVVLDVEGSVASLALAGDGKLLLAGTADGGASLLRLAADGSLDTGYGNNGVLAVPLAGSVASVQVQSGGAVLVGGTTAGGDMVAVRVFDDGFADSGFGGGDGVAEVDFGGDDQAQAMGVQADGKVVLAGWAGSNIAVARLNADGSLDGSFGDGGKVSLDTGNTGRAHALHVFEDGQVVVVGMSEQAPGFPGVAVARIGADGTLLGLSTFNRVAASQDTGLALVVQDDGKVLVAATSTLGSDSQELLLRFNADGSLDTGFGPTTQYSLGSTVDVDENGAMVTLESAAFVFDLDLAFDSYAGTTLTLARHGGASADDVFSFAAPYLTDGQTLSWGGMFSIASYTLSGGVLTLTFLGGVHQSEILNALRNITYGNSSDTPPSSVQIDWTFSDGNTGAQGDGGPLLATGSTTVRITAVNDAPVIADPGAFDTSLVVSEGDAAPDGVTVAALLPAGLAADADNADLGIAIVAVDTSLGTWQYKLQGGDWLDMDTARLNSTTTDHVLLLGPADAVRLLPFGDLHGSVSAGLTVRAWDMTQGSAGQTLQPEGVGGSSAFSSAVETVTLQVQDANEAPSFAWQPGDGQVEATASAGSFVRAVLVQPDGALVLGTTVPTQAGGMAVQRFLADGSADAAFDGAAAQSIATLLGDAAPTLVAVARQADGKLLLTGATTGGNQLAGFVLRLNADGTADTGFGDQGLVRPGGDVGLLTTVHPLADGQILLAGSQADAGGLVALRLLADGSIDPAQGVVSLPHPEDYADTTALAGAVQADGKLLLVGAAEAAATSYDTFLLRLDTNGQLDASFGIGGGIVVPQSGLDLAWAVAVRPDGRIVVGAQSPTQVSVLQFLADGSADTSFGSNGVSTLPAGAAFGPSGMGLVLLADGSILVSGNTADGSGGTNGDATVTRLTASGAVDSSFGQGGVARIGTAGSHEDGVRLAVQPDGHIVLAATSNAGGTSTPLLVRLLANGQLDTSFDKPQALSVEGTSHYVEGVDNVQPGAAARVVDADLATLAGGDGNYGGSTLILVRVGGASAEDRFTTGNALAFQEGGGVTLGDVQIGTLDPGLLAQGELRITFSDGLTQTGLNDVLRSICFSNSADAPPSSVQLQWTFSDGNNGTQGVGGPATATGISTVEITATNDAPVIGPMQPNQYAYEDNGQFTEWLTVDLSDPDGSTPGFDIGAMLADGWATVDDGAHYFKGGTYGTAYLRLEDNWLVYELDNSLQATNALAQDQVVTESFTLYATDGEAGVSRSVTFTAVGHNDTPSVSADAQPWLVVEAGASDGTPTVTRQIRLDDPDSASVGLDGPAMVANGWTWSGNGALFTRDGTYGIASIDMASRVLSYTLDDSRAATQALTEGQAVTDTFGVWATDGQAGGHGDVSIAITGRNDKPVLAASNPGASVSEAGGSSNTGGTATALRQLSWSDVDGSASISASSLAAAGWTQVDGGSNWELAGTYGTARLETGSGDLLYTLDNARAATQALKTGDVRTESFAVRVTDGSATTGLAVKFTVRGSNDAPTVSAGARSNTVVEAGGVANGTAGTEQATIAVSMADVDGTAAIDPVGMVANGWIAGGNGATYSKTGTYGSVQYVVATGIATYRIDNADTDTQALAQGAQVTDSFRLRVTDGTLTRTADLDFLVEGRDDTPAISLGAQSAALVEASGVSNGTPGTSVATIVASKSDPDSSVAWSASGLAAAGWTTANGSTYSKAGTYGSATFTLASGAVRYTLGNANASTQALAAGQVVTDEFTLAADGGGVAVQKTVAFGITGGNDAPTVKAGAVSRTVVEGGGTDNTAGSLPTARITFTRADVDGTASWDVTTMLADGWSAQAGGATLTRTGSYGTAVLTLSTGALLYTLDPALADGLTAGQSASDNFTVAVSDGALAGTAVGSFLITGSNDAPRITVGSPSGSLVEAGLNTAGTATASLAVGQGDPDGGAAWDTAALQAGGWTSAGNGVYAKAGTYGNALFDLASGVVSYTLDNSALATQKLKEGQVVTDSFRVAATDGALTGTGDARFTITGSNDAPAVAASAANRAVVEAGGVGNAIANVATARITVTKTDAEGTPAWDTAGMTAAGWTLQSGGATLSIAGTYGTAVLTLATGALNYTLDQTLADGLAAGQSATDSFTVLVTDGSAGASTVASFAITGSNDAPRVSAGTPSATLVEAGAAGAGTSTATLALARSDVDGATSWDTGALSAAGWTVNLAAGTAGRAGTYGAASLNLASGVLTYTLDNNAAATQALGTGQSVTDSFTVTATDGALTASTVASFAITGSNDRPTLTLAPPTNTLQETGGSSNGTQPVSWSGVYAVDAESGTASIDYAAMALAGWSIAAGGGTLTKAGLYGTLTLTAADGLLTYVLDASASDVLAAGQTATDSFVVQVTDGLASTSGSVAFTILGSNDAPRLVASAQSAALVEAGASGNGTASASITVTRSDPDGTAAWDTAALASNGWTTTDGGLNYKLAGIFGTASFKPSTGVVSYALGNGTAATQALTDGQVATDSFRIGATDGSLSSSLLASFQIAGSNDAPTLKAGAANRVLVEAGGTDNQQAGVATARITLTKGDVDGTASWDLGDLISTGWMTSDAGTTFAHAGTYGSAVLTTATGVLNYTLDNTKAATEALAGGQTVTDSFTLKVGDGLLDASTTAAFTIQGADDITLVGVAAP